MTDGGSSNTPVVLFDNNLSAIDAVVRSLPSEQANIISTSTAGGGCPPKTFNLDQVPVVYEQLGMSAGRGNSFARVLDGDCGWLKDPQQSANASNNRGGRTSDITYNFSMVDAVACTSIGGRVDVYVEHVDMSTVFPMNYTLATDTNEDGIFDMNDSYATFVDSTAPFIEVKSLPVGRYRLTVSSRNGCYLKTFEFFILPCYPLLPVQLEYFRYAGHQNSHHILQWKLHGMENLQAVVLQKSLPGAPFADNYVEQKADIVGTKAYSVSVSGNGSAFFRLKIVTKGGREFYSPVVSANQSTAISKIWPNPATNVLHLQLISSQTKKTSYSIYSASGKTMKEGVLQLARGQSSHTLDIAGLPAGIYYLQIRGALYNDQPISFRFVKH
jgi:hypothetical protein